MKRVAAFLLCAGLLAGPASAESIDVPETVPPPIRYEDLPLGRLADLAIPIYRAIPAQGTREGEVVRGSGVVVATQGLARGLRYHVRWESSPRRAAHRANLWAAAMGPEMRLLLATDEEAEWEAAPTDAPEGDARRILRIGRFVAEVRGARGEVRALVDALRPMARAAAAYAPGLLVRPARGVFLAADPIPASDRIRIWVHGRDPDEIRLERIRLRLPRGLVSLGPESFRAIPLSDRIEIVVEGVADAELSRARVWAEGRTTDGVAVRTVANPRWP